MRQCGRARGRPVFALCGQALDIEPNNVHALVWLATKSYSQIALGGSPEPNDLARADLLVSKALVIDPNYGREVKGEILRLQGRVDEAIRRVRACARRRSDQRRRYRIAGQCILAGRPI